METVHDRNLSGSDVSNHLGDEEGVELRTISLVLAIVLYLILEGLDTTNTYAVNHTNAVLVFCLQIHAAILNGLLSSNQGQLGVAVHLASFLAIQIVVYIEVLYLTSKLCLE